MAVAVQLNGYTTWNLTESMEKNLVGTTQEYYKLFWTDPGRNSIQISNCTATYLLSHKSSK